MEFSHVRRLENFGTRSLVTHAIMVLTFAGTILAALFVEGQLGQVSFVALLTFTAGLWVAHSVHSLGHVQTDGEYEGVLNELLDVGADSGDGFDAGRFGRLLVLIAGVTAVSLLTSTQALEGALLSVAFVAVGTIAVMTAMTGFLIALGASYDGDQDRPLGRLESGSEAVDVRGTIER